MLSFQSVALKSSVLQVSALSSHFPKSGLKDPNNDILTIAQQHVRQQTKSLLTLACLKNNNKNQENKGSLQTKIYGALKTTENKKTTYTQPSTGSRLRFFLRFFCGQSLAERSFEDFFKVDSLWSRFSSFDLDKSGTSAWNERSVWAPVRGFGPDPSRVARICRCFFGLFGKDLLTCWWNGKEPLEVLFWMRTLEDGQRDTFSLQSQKKILSNGFPISPTT